MIVQRSYANVLRLLRQCRLPGAGGDIDTKIYGLFVGEQFDAVRRAMILGGPVSVLPVAVHLMELAHCARPHVPEPWRPAIREALEELERTAREWDERHG